MKLLNTSHCSPPPSSLSPPQPAPIFQHFSSKSLSFNMADLGPHILGLYTTEAITFAVEHGIHLITLPPHCTHKMQPLDRTYFKALKANYNAAADRWMVSNPGNRITFFQMAELFGKAFAKSSTQDKAVSVPHVRVVALRPTRLWRRGFLGCGGHRGA